MTRWQYSWKQRSLWQIAWQSVWLYYIIGWRERSQYYLYIEILEIFICHCHDNYLPALKYKILGNSSASSCFCTYHFLTILECKMSMRMQEVIRVLRWCRAFLQLTVLQIYFIAYAWEKCIYDHIFIMYCTSKLIKIKQVVNDCFHPFYFFLLGDNIYYVYIHCHIFTPY